jgi:hypothetical protein
MDHSHDHRGEHLNKAQFKAEFDRMARKNGVRPSKREKLIDEVFRLERRPVFHNVFQGFNRNSYLLVTRGAAYNIRTGVLGVHLEWVVPHEDLDGEAYSSRSKAMGYTVDEVVFPCIDRLKRFKIGFSDRRDPVGREIARNNCQVVADEINSVAMRPASADGTEATFDSKAPRKAKEVSFDGRLAAALRSANTQLQLMPVDVRAAACGYLAGDLRVAVVVAGECDLHESLDRLPGPRPVQEILNVAFAAIGEAQAVFHNDRTWREEERSGDWLALLPAESRNPTLVRTARPIDVKPYGAQEELPAMGFLYVACQWRTYATTAAEAAQHVHQIIADNSWPMHSYQLVTSRGRAYWWNGGGLSEAWLLHRPDAADDSYLVSWDTEVAWIGDDYQQTVRTAGETLDDEVRSGNLELLVTDRHGKSVRIRPPIPG